MAFLKSPPTPVNLPTMLTNRRALLSLIIALMLFQHSDNAADLLVYFGLHVDQPDKGISIAHFNTDTGVLSEPKLVAQAAMPGYFVIDPTGKFLYSVNSFSKFKGEASGALSAYAIDAATGNLRLINQVASSGANPAFIALDGNATHVLAANYTGGSISVFAIRSDGGIGDRTAFVQHSGHSVNPDRQQEPHPHAIYVDPTDRYVLVPDLGQDKVFVYRYDNKSGSLSANVPPFGAVAPGAGPRHLAFHPNGRWVYVVDEMGGTVTQFNWDSNTGTLSQPNATRTTPDDFNGVNTSGEVRISADGKFLYATNRGPDDLAVFSIDPATGGLTFLQRVPTQGKMPRFFTFDPTGHWLIVCNHDSDNAVVFKVDPDTGRLTQNGEPIKVPNPYCAEFLVTK